MQTFSASNLKKYQEGQQMDIAIGDGANATSTIQFLSFEEFSYQEEPESMPIVDSQGNRSTSTNVITGRNAYPIAFSGKLDVNKLGTLVYYLTGSVASVQDGATGAYTHTYAPLNNVILPEFTVFLGLDALAETNETGHKKLTGCTMASLTVSSSGSELNFAGTAWARSIVEDTPNSSSVVATLTITDAVYQSASGLIRYSFSGTPVLSSVVNGDVLDVGDTDSDFANATNRGSFTVVNVDDASDFVEVINPQRTDNTDDETAVVVDNGNEIKILITPAYSVGKEMANLSCVQNAVNIAGLAAATADGFQDFSIEYNNNSAYIYEGVKTNDALVMISKNIDVNTTFTQILNTDRGDIAERTRRVNSAWKFEVEDVNQVLGTSTTVFPLVSCTTEALGAHSVPNQGSADDVRVDWALISYNQQTTSIIVQNEIAAYPV